MPKRSTRHSSSGFTLLELLVGLAIAVSITGVALTLALSTRNLFERDQTRIRLNQSIRTGKDFLSTDIRQAGERMGDDIFALEIVDGAPGAPDELIIRRNLEETVLKVCFDVTSVAQTWILLSVPPGSPFGPAPPGCDPAPDDDGDGWPDDIQIFRDRRVANGGTLRAYVYDPINEGGEFFDWGNDLIGWFGAVLFRSSTQWTTANIPYTVANQSRIHLLEEHRYRLQDNTLQLIIDGDFANPTNLVDGLKDFQARVVFADGTTQDALSPPNGDDWSDIWSRMRAIEVTLDAGADHNGIAIDRSWSSEVMPRNLLSR